MLLERTLEGGGATPAEFTRLMYRVKGLPMLLVIAFTDNWNLGDGGRYVKD